MEELRGVELSYLFINELACLVCGGTVTAADVAILRHPPPEGWEICVGCGDSVRVFGEHVARCKEE